MQNVEAIVVMPVNADALIDVLNMANDAGIIIIVIGPQVQEYPSSVKYVYWDFYGLGVKHGEDFRDKENLDWRDGSDPAKIQVFIFNNADCNRYLDGLLSVLQPYADEGVLIIDVYYVDSPQNAFELLSYLLTICDGKIPDATFTCFGDIAQALWNAFIQAGFDIGEEGTGVYGLETYFHGEKMAEAIACLIENMLNGEEVNLGEVEYIEIN